MYVVLLVWAEKIYERKYDHHHDDDEEREEEDENGESL